MWIVGLVIFILNGILCLFSLSLFINQKKRQFIIHSVIYLFISMMSVYLYLKSYLLEAFITFFLFGGVQMIFDENLLPKIMKEKNNLLTYFGLFSLIICGFIFIRY